MIITRTPFRVSFFGGGTDYPAWFRDNSGAVLATSIDKYCYLNMRHLPPFFDHKHCIVYSKIELPSRIEDIEHPVVRAVLSESNSDNGFLVHHDGDLPARSGLGSSSAFTVGLLNALNSLHGRMTSKRDLANEAIRIEQDVIKENVGCQDQIATALGGFNLIEFHRNGGFDAVPVVAAPHRLDELQNSLMLFFTGKSRLSSEIAGEHIRKIKDNVAELRAMQGMVEQALEILQNDSLPLGAFGELLHESWQLKRSLTGTVSTPRIDEIYAAGRDAGAIGGKLLGAGGGGFILFFVPPEKHAAVRERLSDLVHVDFRFETGGSRVIVYEPNGLESV